MVKLISRTLSIYGEPNLLGITFIDLINLKTCIGVSRELWNPNARFFTIGFRGGYSIIDLRFIFLSLRRALLFVKLSARQRARIAHVTNSRFYDVFRKTAGSRKMTILNNWISGFLTNYKNVGLHYKELKHKGAYLFGYPNVLVSFELAKKHDFIRNEARRINLPFISFIDSDMDFSKSLYGIIGNNDSFSFLRLCFRTIVTLVDSEESLACRKFYFMRGFFFRKIRPLLRVILKGLRPKKRKNKKFFKRFLRKCRKISKRLLTIGFEPIPINYRSDFKSDASTKFRQVRKIRKEVKKLKMKLKEKEKLFKLRVEKLNRRLQFAKVNYIPKDIMDIKGLKKPSYYYYNLDEFNNLTKEDKILFLRKKRIQINPFRRAYRILLSSLINVRFNKKMRLINLKVK